MTDDAKLGQVVFIGETGRGRRFEKISLSRRNPAEVQNGKVQEAVLAPVTLNKGTEREFTFQTLEKSTQATEAFLVRINTEGTYTKYCSGTYRTVTGKPETLINAYGAYGIAGRIGNWDDGLVVMRPGDVIKVTLSGGSKLTPYAIAYTAKGLEAFDFSDWEVLTATEAATAKIVEATEAPEALPLVIGQVPCFTFHCGKVSQGISVGRVPAGLAIVLGEEGRGRKSVSVPLVGFEEQPLIEAAVAKLSEETIPARYYGDQPTTKVKYGLINAALANGAALVRVNTSWVYTRGTNGRWEAWKGNSVTLVSGQGAHGDAGNVCNWQDGLVILREGDVLYVHPEGGRKTSCYALYLSGGKLQSQEWQEWKVVDGMQDPEFYVNKGTAPWDHVPAEWVGKVVKVRGWGGSNA